MKILVTVLLLALSFGIFQPTIFAQKTISGFVLDEMGEPLIGANVMLQDGMIGTATSIDGSFDLVIPSYYLEVDLKISYLGYQPVFINFDLEKFDSAITQMIRLRMDYTNLSEIIVMDYKVPIYSRCCCTTGAVVAETRCNSYENCNNPEDSTDVLPKSILRVFPNPFVHSFDVEVAIENEETCLFQLFGIDGKFIFEESRFLTKEDEVVHINLPNPDLPVGAYVLRISSKNKTVRSMILNKVSWD